MRQLMASGTLEKPPTQRELVDARRTLKARFREPLSHVQTSAGAMQAVEILLEASAAEPDRSLKWLMRLFWQRVHAAHWNHIMTMAGLEKSLV